MPHKQKENHNHAARSKKDRLRAKEEAEERRRQKAAAKAREEAEAALRLGGGNNIAPVEGHGAYEIGCAPEREYKFNVRKRSKRHLRTDLIKKEEREELEAREREEEAAAAARLPSSSDDDEEEDGGVEEPVVVEEYVVYICECCDKRYATKNQFLNHLNSKRHKDMMRIYEDLGLCVTHVELRGENGNEQDVYDDFEEDAEWGSDDGSVARRRCVDTEQIEEASADEEEYVQPRQNLFATFADDSSSSSSESSDDVDDCSMSALPEIVNSGKEVEVEVEVEQAKEAKEAVEDNGIGFDLDEIIHQNRILQEQIDADAKTESNTHPVVVSAPLPFDEDSYDPKDYDINENRLAAVQHRLQRRLAARGLEPSHAVGPTAFAPSAAVAVGRTLLREVMDADIATLQAKLAAYRQHKEDCALLGRAFARANGNSKGLPAQYVFRKDPADNARTRANVHHAGSHYHMQAARSMQFGRRKGMMARHSSQGARLQASRMAAKETARMHAGGGGMKAGKTGKKSNAKRRGLAGGSKKTGGDKGDREV